MKKLLALILALLMVASTLSLAACSKDEDKDNDPDDDEGYEYNEQDTEKETSDGEDTDGTDTDDYDDSNRGEWIDKKDQICVGLDNVALREGPGRDYEIVAKVNNGKVLDRIGTNGNWHKVKYDGEECYISSSLTSLDVQDFEFEAYPENEQINLHVKGDFKINLRTTPFYNEDYSEDNLAFSGFGASETDSQGESLKLLAKSKSGDWYKVSFTGTWGSKSYENSVFYLAATSAKYVEGLGATTSSEGGDNVRG